MKDLKQRLRNFSNNVNSNSYLSLMIITLIIVIFFWKFFLKELVPFPGDFVVGVYYPWLDYKPAHLPAGVPVKNPLLADVPSLIYPLRIHAMQILKSGEIPLWNDLQFSGYPLLATFQSAVFNPLNILFYFFSEINAWSLQVILQPLFAGIFMFYFLQDLKLSKTAGILGSVAFAFSGFNSIWLEYNVHGHVSALIPLLLLLTNRFWRTENIKWLIGISFALALQIFAGYPQVTFYTIILIILFSLYKNQKKITNKSSIIKLSKLGVFVGLGVALSAIQILPGYELMNQSQRLVEGVAGGRDAIFLPYRQLITIFAPDVFGNPTTLNYWGIGDYTNNVGYSGVVVFVLSTLAVLKVKRSEVKFFFIVAVGSLLLALPSPISSALYNSGIPGVGAAVATRILVLFNLSLAVLASFGVNYLQSNKLDLKEVARLFYLPVIVLFSTGIVIFAVRYWFVRSIPELATNQAAIDYISPQILNYKVFLRNLVLPSVFTFLTFALLSLKFKFKRSTSLVTVLLVLLVTAELFRFGWKYNSFSEKSFVYPTTPVWEFLQSREEPYRISGGDVVPISMWIPYGLESASGYDAIYPGRIAKFISVANTNNPDASPMGRFGELENYNSKLFDLTNTEYIMALNRNEIAVPDPNGKVSYKFDIEKLEPVFDDKTVVVMKNKDVVPRVFLVNDWEVINDEQAILERLLDDDFSYQQKVVLEHAPSIEKNINNDYHIEDVTYDTNQYKIKLQTENPALLITLDSWYPGWKAYVNGKEKDILKANYVYRAVDVDEGDNIVEFVYKPDSLVLGKRLSGIAIVILSIVLLYEVRILGKVNKSK